MSILLTSPTPTFDETSVVAPASQERQADSPEALAPPSLDLSVQEWADRYVAAWLQGTFAAQAPSWQAHDAPDLAVAAPMLDTTETTIAGWLQGTFAELAAAELAQARAQGDPPFDQMDSTPTMIGAWLDEHIAAWLRAVLEAPAITDPEAAVAAQQPAEPPDLPLAYHYYEYAPLWNEDAWMQAILPPEEVPALWQPWFASTGRPLSVRRRRKKKKGARLTGIVPPRSALIRALELEAEGVLA